jgi:hypothetical protein
MKHTTAAEGQICTTLAVNERFQEGEKDPTATKKADGWEERGPGSLDLGIEGARGNLAVSSVVGLSATSRKYSQETPQ